MSLKNLIHLFSFLKDYHNSIAVPNVMLGKHNYDGPVPKMNYLLQQL